jgi:hypothetical protein
MAAVATVAWIDTASAGGTLFIGHIGDPRAHVFDEDGAGCQNTHDQGAIDADAVPESETLAAPGRNVVASALGLERWSGGDWSARVEIRKLILEAGHALVLVSDGISDYLDRARTAAVVAEHGRSPEALARALVAAAVEAQTRAGTGDNLGVVVVRRPGTKKRAQRAAGSRRPIAAALALGTGLGLLAAEVIHASAAVREAQPPTAASLEAVEAGGPVEISIGPRARVKIGERAIVLEGADVRIDLGDAICVPAGNRDPGGSR